MKKILLSIVSLLMFLYAYAEGENAIDPRHLEIGKSYEVTDTAQLYDYPVSIESRNPAARDEYTLPARPIAQIRIIDKGSVIEIKNRQRERTDIWYEVRVTKDGKYAGTGWINRFDLFDIKAVK